MSKIAVASLSVLLVMLLDSLAMKSGVLSVFDFAGIYVLLVWFNLARRSEAGAWLLCLVISIIFGIFRQRNLAELILALTLALLLVNLLQLGLHVVNYHLVVILGFFCFLVLIFAVAGGGLQIGKDILFVLVNSALAYGLQLLLTRRLEQINYSGMKYK